MIQTGLDEGVAQRVPPFQIMHLLLAGPPPEGIVPGAEFRLHPHEIAKHVRIGPAAVAELRPNVEVGRLAAVEDKAVDGAGPAKNPPAGNGHGTALGAPAAAGIIQPVGRGLFQKIHEAGRNPDQRVMVRRTCLKKADADRGILAQSVGKNAPRRARTDNDIVEYLRHGMPALPLYD